MQRTTDRTQKKRGFRMDDGIWGRNPITSTVRQPQNLTHAITDIHESELSSQAVEKKVLIPAITYGSEPELKSQIADAFSEQKIIFVNEQETAILQMADNIEKKCYREAMTACATGMRPAVYEVNGETERERAILSIANNLPDKYQRECNLQLRPVLLPSPRPTDTVLSEVNVCEDAQAKNTVHSVGPDYLGTCVYTDMELAQLFIRRVPIKRRGQKVYIFNGEYYQVLTENELHTKIVEYLRKELGVSGRAQRIRSIADSLLVEPDIQAEECTISSEKICLLNGILDIGTLGLHHHTPMYFVDWQLNSMWKGSNADCPNFDRFLRDVTGGVPTLLKRFWQATGYLLVGKGNIAKRIFLLTGPSDAGKSVYGSLLREFHHPEQISSVDAFKLGDRFSISTLVNARLNLAMDLPYGYLCEQAVGMIKSISGSDAVTVEEKYHSPYTTKINCKLVFGTNHPIRATVEDRALARRLMVLPFSNSIPKERQDPYLLNRLLEERPAILYRAIQAYKELEANKYIFEGDDLFDNDIIMGIGSVVTTAEDTIGQFVNSCCVKAPEKFTPTEQIYEAYKTFCRSRGTSCAEGCQRFSARLRPVIAEKLQAERSKKRVGGSPVNGYLGIQLVSEYSQRL